VTAYPAWTPAPRPGIVPLHPYGFGTTLGRSFTALRQNPGVLLGFALGVQALAFLVLILVTGGVAFAAFSRLDTLTPGTEDFEAVTAGSIAITAVTGIVLTLAAGALGVLVQGVVVSEVAHAVVAEKLPLRGLWRRVRPVIGRLLGYAFLLLLAVLVVVAVVVAILFALGAASVPIAIFGGILTLLAAIPLTLWLNTKLLLVPAVLILEHARIGQALQRSWRLTRTRFWPTLGIIVIISLTFGVLAQLVGIPLQFVALGLTTIVTPTGEPEAGALIAFLITAVITQVVTILIQCIALIVQSTATALVYVDCRMRHEGLDLDLLAYVERRDAGAQDLPDPYRLHIGRELAPRMPAPAAYPAPGGATPAYAGAPIPGSPPPAGVAPLPPYAASGYGMPSWPPPSGAPVPGPPATGAPAPAAPAAAPATPPPPTPTTWAPPGAPTDSGRP
jgi:hypothetical protein